MKKATCHLDTKMYLLFNWIDLRQVGLRAFEWLKDHFNIYACCSNSNQITIPIPVNQVLDFQNANILRAVMVNGVQSADESRCRSVNKDLQESFIATRLQAHVPRVRLSLRPQYRPEHVQ